MIGLFLIATGLLVTAISVPLLRGMVKMNGLYGVRFPKSFQSDAIWYDVNKFGAKRLIFWSVPVVAAGLVSMMVSYDGDDALAYIFGLAPICYLISAVECYLYLRKL